MKKIRINILIDFYTAELCDILNKSIKLVENAKGDNPNFHQITKSAKSLFADFIVFKVKARKFIELSGMPYAQTWAASYESEAQKNFEFLLS